MRGCRCPNRTRQKVRADMGKVVDIESDMEHEVAELICLKCFDRWIGVYPPTVLLKDIECKCGAIGYVIKTGQTIESEVAGCR